MLDRDALVEVVALALAGCKWPHRPISDLSHVYAPLRDDLRALARAALAVIEPVLRADIARELDCGCECRDAVLAAKTRTEQQYACGRDPCSALEAREIGGGSNGG